MSFRVALITSKTGESMHVVEHTKLKQMHDFQNANAFSDYS